MPNVKLNLESDYGPVVKTFEVINAEIKKTDENTVDLGNDTKAAFEKMTGAAKNYGKEVNSLSDKNNRVISDTKAQVEEIKRLSAARKLSNDPSQIAKYNKSIEDARIKIKALNVDEKKRSDDNKKATTEQIGIITKLLDKQRLLTEARDKSNSPELIKRYNKLIDETKNKLTDLTNTERTATKSSGSGSSGLAGILSVAGGNLLFAGINKVKQGFQEAVGLQISFEKQLKNLAAITGASAKDLVFYGQAAIEMGRNIEGGAVAAVEAFKLIGSAKPELLENKEALVAVTDAAITLSQASGLTLPESAKNLGTALNAFEAPARDAAKFINVLAGASKFGAQEIPFVTDALSKFGGVAKQAKVSIEESAAAIEILGAKIPEASIVGTNLRGVLIVLQTEAAKQGRAFKGLGAELDLLGPKVKDITYLEKTFGRENLLAAQTLISQREELNKLTAEITGTNSAFEQAATNTDTLAQSLLNAGNAYDSLILSIKSGNGVLKSIADGATNLLNNAAAAVAGNGEVNSQTQAIQKLTGANKELAKSIAETGVIYHDFANDVSLVSSGAIKLEYITKGLNGEQFKLVQNTAAYGQGLQLSIDKINSSSNAETASLRIKALLSTQAQSLKKQNDDGAISLTEYTVKLNLLNKAIKDGIIPSFKKTEEEAQKATGIIGQLQADITSLTQERIDALSESDILRLTTVINAKQKELDRLLGNANKDIKQAKDEFERAIKELREKANKASLEDVSGEEKLAAQEKINEEELSLLKAHFIKLGKATDANFKLSAAQQEQFAIIESAAAQRIADGLVKLEVDKQNKIASAKKDGAAKSLEILNLQEQNAISGVESVQPLNGINSFDNAQLEKSKQKEIISIQESYAQQKLALQLELINAESNQAVKAANGELELIKNKNGEEFDIERKAITDKLTLDQVSYAEQAEAARKGTDVFIRDLKQKKADLEKQPSFDLASFLGVSEQQLNSALGLINDIGSATQSAVDSYFDLQNSIVDAEIEKNEKLVQEREKNIDSLKSQLEKEVELGKEGKANNYTRIQEQLAFEEEARQQSIRDEQAAKAEKAKLAKEQLIIDTIVQASNLVVAATQIYATVAKDPYSTAIATATVVAMLAAFTIQKANAFKSVNQDIQNSKFDKGGYTGDGGKYEEAGIVHKGEFVTTKENTAKNRPLLEYIHTGDERLAKNALMNLIENTGISLSDNLPEVISMKKEIVRTNEINAYLKTDNSRLEKEMSEMKTILFQILEENKDKNFLDQDGNLVRKKGSNVNIIRKK